MGTEGLLSPQMLWLLLWVQLCRGKCQLLCSTAHSQQVPVWSLGFAWEWGFFAGATEMRGRGCSGPWTLCLSLCPSGWVRISPFPGLQCSGQPVPGWIHRQPVLGYPFGIPSSPALYLWSWWWPSW